MKYRMRITPIDKWVIQPVNRFVNKSTTGGIVLFVSAVIALILANSPWKDAYHHFWEYNIKFGVEGYVLDKTLHHWINDGLMAIFFFVVGLELKREILGGELSNPRNAILPVAAGLGGMIFPALLYLVFNTTGEAQNGWGIPMATDIAFALGVLFLLGDRVPASLKLFLTALAIADDIGAVLVIAFFYTSNISYVSLLVGSAFLLLLILSNVLGVRSTIYYGILGIGGLWMAFLLSGVHATIAGVLAAFTIPATVRIDEVGFVEKMKMYLEKFKNADPNGAPTVTPKQLHILEDMRTLSKLAMTPLQRLEHGMHPFVTYIVMPIFALANAGVTLSTETASSTTSFVAIGIIVGLLVGKFIGIVGVSSLMVKLKIATLPEGMNFKHLIGAGFLASIGFTMSLFVANLAFKNNDLIQQAKIGILIASLIGGLIGFLFLYFNKSEPKYDLNEQE
ncbi:Na+/H+ antiporter NhaA [Flavobacterium sp.]|uniref:Na+/H+ antiporter NhaA n=1 Tax=Flavobacterium sp. TaxID=239 RepID=UPI002620F093|nr:Na+/H+ antiporter NhaA [Flavobacterium sp.]MDD2986425.1 Na+/H+ antiporter NhaA [Flavobacterium sp.]